MSHCGGRHLTHCKEPEQRRQLDSRSHLLFERSRSFAELSAVHRRRCGRQYVPSAERRLEHPTKIRDEASCQSRFHTDGISISSSPGQRLRTLGDYRHPRLQARRRILCSLSQKRTNHGEYVRVRASEHSPQEPRHRVQNADHSNQMFHTAHAVINWSADGGQLSGDWCSPMPGQARSNRRPTEHCAEGLSCAHA